MFAFILAFDKNVHKPNIQQWKICCEIYVMYQIAKEEDIPKELSMPSIQDSTGDSYINSFNY